MLNDQNFINIAHEISKGSSCVSKLVGSLIVKDGRIISTGYNGTPKGYPNCSDHWKGEYTKDHHDWSLQYEIHAEMNALIWAARQGGTSVEGATIYATLQPCSQCTKNIIAAGIKRIVYDIPYEHSDTEQLTKFIQDNNVEYIQVSKS